MKHLTADEGMLARLRGILVPVEFRDPDGKVLGHYTPLVSDEERALYAKVRAMFDPAEMKRRKAEDGKRHTTEEVLAHLRSLEERELREQAKALRSPENTK